METKKKHRLLEKEQREALIQWVAEGLETDEINKRALKFKPPFKVSRQQVDHYRKTRKVDLNEIKHSGEMTALTSGLALRENRVALLQKMADQMIYDLLNNNLLWTDEVKGIGGAENFEKIEYKEFNGAEVAQLRGVLDDIASEMGQRAPNVKVENNNFFDINSWKKQREERLKQASLLPAE